MNKTELINILANKFPNLSHRDIKEAVNLIIEELTQAVASDKGVEIRGFGSFCKKTRAAYIGKHPRNLQKVAVSKKYIPLFKAGKALKEAVKNL